MNINNLAAPTAPQDFVGVKIGDLNGSVSANLLGGGIEERGSGFEFVLEATDRKMKKGEVATVDFTADMLGLVGYQFTLDFDQTKIRVKDLTPGKDATAANFGLARIDEGAITASWHQLAAAKKQSDAPLFSITFEALADGQISDWLKVDSRFTKAAGYEEDGSVREVVLDFGRPESSLSANAFELFQNVPNPFNGATVIGFQLPEKGMATLTVFDVSGQVVKTVKGEFAAGYHKTEMTKEELGHPGVFYYRLETAGHTATMKMTLF